MSVARLGVVSNPHYWGIVHARMERMDIRQYISVVLTSDRHGEPKPSSSIFHAAAQQLWVRPGAVLHVGNSYTTDYQGAHGAGMRAVLVDPARSTGAPAPDVIDTVLDIRDWIREHG